MDYDKPITTRRMKFKNEKKVSEKSYEAGDLVRKYNDLELLSYITKSEEDFIVRGFESDQVKTASRVVDPFIRMIDSDSLLTQYVRHVKDGRNYKVIAQFSASCNKDYVLLENCPFNNKGVIVTKVELLTYFDQSSEITSPAKVNLLDSKGNQIYTERTYKVTNEDGIRRIGTIHRNVLATSVEFVFTVQGLSEPLNYELSYELR